MPTIASLLIPVDPLTPEHTVDDVGELFLADAYRRCLCLPVVLAGKPVGSVSRTTVQHIFMHKFGRAVHGQKRVAEVMNASPLIVADDQPLEHASRYITDHISSPVTEDFIVTRNGNYLGTGSVVDLLRAMEGQVLARNAQLQTAYQQLRASQAHLVQSEKMASLGQMVAGVAHEINTPLGYVKNNVALARDIQQHQATLLDAYDKLLATFAQPAPDPDDITRQWAALQDLRQAFAENYPASDTGSLFDDTLYGIDQISDIVINLKNFSRLDQAADDNVDLNACVDSALLIARNVIKHKAEVVRDFGTLPRIRCCPSQINQVLLNLLTNAAQAIEHSGQIRIKTVAAADFVHVYIQDDGRGIAEENLKKIFDPFFTTKPVGEGTGLGLSISYKIVRDHRGHLRVASKPGVGTRFCVSLPRHQHPQ